MRTLRAAAAWLALPALLTAIACSTNPATGNKQLNLYSQEQEIALGRHGTQPVVRQSHGFLRASNQERGT